ncbi:hypothetical protein, partial [Roseiflexus castenholzii]|uniref:hypothetical protein n=1 Tax=Roseiflexus castenholzii TaxID=120962 RepID=UPI003C79CE5F
MQAGRLCVQAVRRGQAGRWRAQGLLVCGRDARAWAVRVGVMPALPAEASWAGRTLARPGVARMRA